jgi:HAE1 family hydrophobic/amphiphilic exporter-1
MPSQAQPLPPMPSLTRLGVDPDKTITLSLNDAIRRALESNNDIEVARNDVKIQEQSLYSLLGIYQPVLNFTPQYNHSISPTSSSLGGAGSAGTLSTTALTWNSNVTKSLQNTGGNYTVFFNNNRQNTSNSFSSLNPTFSTSMGVTYFQPLLRDREVDSNRHSIQVQRKRLEQSDADFRRRTIEIIQQVQRAYWDLVFAVRNQANQLENLKLSRENLRKKEAQIAAGAAAPLERAEVLTELANREATVLSATQQISTAENTLKQLLIKDPSSPDWTSALMPTDTPKFDTTPVALADVMSAARKNRPELQRQQLQKAISDLDLKYFENQTKPRIDFSATFSTTGLAGTDAVVNPDPTKHPPTFLVGGYGHSLHNLFTFDTRTISFGATIQIPLHNKTAEANFASTKIARTQLEASTRQTEQVIEVEVRNAAQAVETSRRRVLTARIARQNAELQLQGEQRLYQVGRSTTFLLFQRENALANAKNSELQAETDYNKAVADLQKATSTTLTANNIIVANPAIP